MTEADDDYSRDDEHSGEGNDSDYTGGTVRTH